MVYHWQSHSVKLCGVDDMVLLPRPSEETIVDNLRKRFLDDYIYTSIGPVLISVNPFRQMPYYGDKEIEQYQGAALYENPPHVYGLSDQMYRNLLVDNESQCVIISGESGAGKTVAARYIMNYIAKVSGGSAKVQEVKNVVLNSNPLLEAFGNAKTIRNNNSSRFGKYVEIVFDAAGQPVGGKISNFLLEKSRIPNLSSGERNFHILYQLCVGANSSLKNDLGIVSMKNFNFLKNGGSFQVEGINDAKDFEETSKAMKVIGFTEVDQKSIWNIVAAILHLGNVNFHENGNYAEVTESKALEWPAYLMGIDKSQLKSKLTSRLFESKWGAGEELINVTLNVEQAIYTRNALAKGLYSKLFDYLVQRVNAAMFTDKKGNNIGILDIYGFEILDKNGFEQLCINFVNEKLQQIFIQLTLKAEQEEYVAEKIAWTPIDFFNNQIVCELLEGRQPPGVFLVLDDVCATMHAVAEGADQDLQKKLNVSASQHKHFSPIADGFVVKHYAGVVSYNVDGFCDRNRDVFFPDLVHLLQTSSCKLLGRLFPETTFKSRPTTAGSKIRAQAGELVAKLMQCSPHYIRCIKPNESKCAREWDDLRVKHQVEYLGLMENISVRRAGFAYRRPFHKFLHRYAILTKESWPYWKGSEKSGVMFILSSTGLKESLEFQLGKSKVFIKNPESLFLLEELREQQYDKYAKVIQRAFKQHFACKQQQAQRMEASALLHGKKERRRFSVNRHFVGDYLGVSSQPELQALIGRRERILFAMPVIKYDRRFKGSARDLVVTSQAVLLISCESNNGGSGSKFVVKRNISFASISHVSLSALQDDFVILHVKDDYDSFLQVPMKTELLYSINKRYFAVVGGQLKIFFSNSAEFYVKKSVLGGGGKRIVVFVPTFTEQDKATLKVNGATLTVGIGAGIPPDASLPIATTQKRRKILTTNQRRREPRTQMSTSPICPAPTRAAPPPPSLPNTNANKLFIPAPKSLGNIEQVDPNSNNNVTGVNSNMSPVNFMNDLSKSINSRKATEIHTNSSSSTSNQPTKTEKPVPGGGRPRPVLRPNWSKVKAVYSYIAQDCDELTLNEGDIIDLIKEHPGGWWQGKLKGKEGLFPANYVQKM